MGRSIKFSKSRKFRGNQHSKRVIPNAGVSTNIISESDPPSNLSQSDSASKVKCKYIEKCDPHILTEEITSGNVIVDISVLNVFINNSMCCKECKTSDSLRLSEISSKRKGLASVIKVVCDFCSACLDSYTCTQTVSKHFETNLRFVYGMRIIGRGKAAGAKFCAAMNLPQPPAHFEECNNTLGKFVEEVAKESMAAAASEIKYIQAEDDDLDDLNDESSKDICVALDGSWQKRGHTSKNGFVSATISGTGKVIDVECLSKFCHGCLKKKDGKVHECKQNYEGSSGGMEVAGALAIFKRSQDLYGLRYTEYLGDGDSSSFKKVSEAEPYGPDVQLTKLECVGHVQKRMGTRLRKFVKDNKGKKLKDGKSVGGKGRLTKKVINDLQVYYGLAIKNNTASLAAMKQNVRASLLHRGSTDEKPLHNFCPKGENSWCKFQKALVKKEKHTHKNPLPFAIMEAIKPIYKDLSKEELLGKCLHGKTQNVNESFNNVVWSVVPKSIFLGLDVLKLGVYDSVISFNDGNLGRLKILMKVSGKDAGVNSIYGFRKLDKRRVLAADKKVTDEAKSKRKRKQRAKKVQEDQEEKDEDYLPGFH